PRTSAAPWRISSRASPPPWPPRRRAAFGNSPPRLRGSVGSMKPLRISCLPAAALFLFAAAAAPAHDQKKSAEISTPAGKFALEVTADYPGMAAGKTVVRLRLSCPQLSKALSSRGVRFLSGEVHGSFSRNEQMVEAFRYPVSGDIDAGRVFTFSFLRPVPPGSYKVRLAFTLPGGKEVGEGTVDISVPELGTAFRPEMAPAEASTLPEAEAIVIADSAPEPASRPE